MMSQRSKRELSDAVRPRYLKASKAGKIKILDEYVRLPAFIASMPSEFSSGGINPKG
jgi:hypothetical protein